ncbi:hypothetical protein [Mesoterricola silvestris]|uniref:Protein TolB n=1 Tax=Mesoterricola silvestris TaxID=2927979 RepID=A0AA48GRK5_9BACT|nr:hypothetical protein [Mesoterricola silvestris]BDU72722.1 hypothetical protein METEAL_18960 [Mesoterricola silvestris]
MCRTARLAAEGALALAMALGPARALAMDPPPGKKSAPPQTVLTVVPTASGGDRIVRCLPDGTSVPVAGATAAADDAEAFAEDVPALEARLVGVSQAVQAGETLFFAERNRVRRIGPDQRVATAATAEGFVTALAVSPRDGTVVFSSQSAKGAWLVQRINPAGQVEVIVGPASSRAAFAHLPHPLRNRVNSLAFTPAGDLLVAENGTPGKAGQGSIHRLRAGGPGGPAWLPLVRIAGGGARPPSATPSLGHQVDLDAPGSLAGAPDGGCYFVHCMHRESKGASLLQAYGQQVCRLEVSGRITALAGGLEETKGDPGTWTPQTWLPLASGSDITQLRVLPDGSLIAVLETGKQVPVPPAKTSGLAPAVPWV